MSSTYVVSFLRKTYRLPVRSASTEDIVDERLELSKRVSEFHQANLDTVYIDVTDTDLCPIITGIQKVGRNLITSFSELDVKFELIRYDFDTNGFVLLTDDERKLFFNRSKGTAPQCPKKKWRLSINNILYRTVKSLGRFLTDIFRWLHISDEFIRALDGSKPGIVRKIRSRQKRIYPLIPFVPVDGVNILLPELIYEQGRVEQYLALKRFFNAKINAIVFDLIPLYHPNLVDFSREFLQYLSVVRECNNIIAISDYTADQISAYLKGWAREKETSLPKVKTVYLPFSSKEEHRSQSPKFEIPTFIFVSTIEPRKNHLKLAQAAEKLMKEGLNFEVLCVGKLGWIDTTSWDSINDILGSGVPIRFLHDVNDVELKDLLRKSWCAVYPSSVEGFGLPIIEADQFGLPVIVSNGSAMRDVCERFVKCYCLVAPDSVQSLYSAMKSFLDSSTENFVINSQVEILTASWREYSAQVYKQLF